MTTNYDPILLEVIKHALAAIADEMGVVLRKASFSPNIKERRDFSCAIFDAQGRMISQAAHIPVHLGSMPLSVAAAIQACSPLSPGDQIILNDPFRGGTHLPDITLVAPVFIPSHGDLRLFGFVASRAHHADIGGSTSGSMAIAREIYQEGLIIPPIKLFQQNHLNQGVLDMILANVRTPRERSGDLWAQIAANQRGAERLLETVNRFTVLVLQQYMEELIAYTERMTRAFLGKIPAGTYRYTDYLDDDGVSNDPIPITASITINDGSAIVDFSGSSPQVMGSLNAVYAITLSAVYYVFRALLGQDVPNTAGCLIPIQVIAPPGSVVNATHPSPVAGGNVETSQRIVDVLLGALARALPNLVPAASQGTMNNLTIGGWDDTRKAPFTYYETIAGGSGARPSQDGISAIHSHMTNTLNTPVEALEYAYPLRVIGYQIRSGSGGKGKFQGGDGIVRIIQLLCDAEISIISERRRFPPYGLHGGQPGSCGENILQQGNQVIPLASKCTLRAHRGDILQISTPGGGGFGEYLENTADPD
jgi:N-methylhydantoinase B